MKTRTPKYRAWDKKEKQMIYEIQDHYYNHIGTDSYDKWTFADFLDNKDIIIMQSIGRKDTNKKEIYEGDIINWRHPKNWLYEKIHKTKHQNTNELMWTWVMKWNNKTTTYNMPDSWLIPTIIGNIFENPK